jgi:hypothetical protein
VTPETHLAYSATVHKKNQFFPDFFVTEVIPETHLAYSATVQKIPIFFPVFLGLTQRR